ncbi:unnamed protein product [Blepharisma stoltei]|uniref:Uncharacterized protein n=1 Tax=Blepharisma stoltei TaxID=1481888 RepID=A0AAU9I3I2_9CILI|nr:unnamed protein product [Blepharisma stoltei]
MDRWHAFWPARYNLLESYPESYAYGISGDKDLADGHHCNIWYIDWNEHATLRIISSHSEEITSIACRSFVASAIKLSGFEMKKSLSKASNSYLQATSVYH